MREEILDELCLEQDARNLAITRTPYKAPYIRAIRRAALGVLIVSFPERESYVLYRFYLLPTNVDDDIQRIKRDLLFQARRLEIREAKS